ncbi:MAG: G8 domain-containing protein [Cyanobacteria bacterium P01_A01_bin.135]
MNMQAHHSSGHTDPAKHKEHMAVMDLVKHGDATHVAVKSGNWSDASTWSNGRVPGDGAKVLIGDGFKVAYNVESEARLKTIRVDGQLDFATQQNTKMVIDTFVVAPEGKLTIGTKNNPVAGNVNTEIWIADNGKIDRGWDPTQVSRGIISHGEVEIYGQNKTTYAKLSQDAMAGDQELVLAEAPKNWKVGDSLVLTGTERVPDKWNSQKKEMEWQGTQDEEVTIKAINGNRVTLDRPLTYDHDTPRGDLKAYLTNFSRNVTVASENADSLPANQRGHVMFMHSDDVDVRYAEFRELGRSDKSELFDDFRVSGNGDRIMNGDTPQAGAANNIRGRYAVHFHRSGDDKSGEPARAVGNAVWGSPGWGFVNHDSYVVMEDNAAYDVFGSAFVTETGNETGAMRNNIAIKSEGSTSISKDLKRAKNHDIGHNGVGFWFQGRLVDNEGNIAAGQRHAGTVYLLRGEDQADVSSQNLDFPETIRYLDSTYNDKPHIESFKDHEVFASNKGLEVIKANPRQGHDARSVIDGLKAWEVRTGTHLEYTSKYTLKNLDLIGAEGDTNTGISFGNNADDMVVNGAKVRGFGRGLKTTKHHTFANIKDWGYYFVDTDIEGSKVNVNGDRFLSSGDLKQGQLDLKLNGNTDFHFNGGETIEINGTKTDSLGSVGYWTGSDSYKISGSGMRNRVRQGYYTDKNGTPFITIEERIADRATGETRKLQYAVTIDDGLMSGAPKLGTYDGTVERGLVSGSLKAFVDSHSGSGDDHSGDHGSNHGGDHSSGDQGSGDHGGGDMDNHDGMDMGDDGQDNQGDMGDDQGDSGQGDDQSGDHGGDHGGDDMDNHGGNDMGDDSQDNQGGMDDDQGDSGQGDDQSGDHGGEHDGDQSGDHGGEHDGDQSGDHGGDDMDNHGGDDMGDPGDMGGDSGDNPQPDAGPAPDSSGSGDTPSTPAGSPIRIEAEDMTLDGYRIEGNGGASGQEVISFIRGNENESGSATTTFNGAAGTYEVKVAYVDETDGQGSLEVKHNDKSVETWQLDQNLGASYITDSTRTQRTLGDRISLSPGDRLQVVGQEQANEHARVDYVELIPVTIGGDSPTPDPTPDQGGTGGDAPDPTGDSSDGGVIGGASGGADTPGADPAPVPTPDSGDSGSGDSGSDNSDAGGSGGDQPVPDPMRLEAEDMSLEGYRIEQNGTFSEGKAISLVGGQANETASASATFDGAAGTYDVVIAYTDETDGEATLEAKLNGQTLSQWQLDQDLGDSYISSGNQVQRILAEGIELKSGDRLELMAQEQGSEHARVDYVEFVPVASAGASTDSTGDTTPPAPAPAPQPTATTVLSTPVTLKGSEWKTTAIDYQVTPNTMMQLEFRSDAEGAIHAIGLDDNALVEATDSGELVQLSGTESWGAGDFDYVTSSGWQTYEIPIGQFASSDAAYLSLLSVDGDSTNGDGGEAMSDFRNVRLYESLGNGSDPMTSDPMATDPMADQSPLAAIAPEPMAA